MYPPPPCDRTCRCFYLRGVGDVFPLTPPSPLRLQVDAAETDECSRLSPSRNPVSPFPVSMFNTVKCDRMHEESVPNKQHLQKNRGVFSVWPNDVTVWVKCLLEMSKNGFSSSNISTWCAVNADYVFYFTLWVH